MRLRTPVAELKYIVIKSCQGYYAVVNCKIKSERKKERNLHLFFHSLFDQTSERINFY